MLIAVQRGVVGVGVHRSWGRVSRRAWTALARCRGWCRCGGGGGIGRRRGRCGGRHGDRFGRRGLVVGPLPFQSRGQRAQPDHQAQCRRAQRRDRNPADRLATCTGLYAGLHIAGQIRLQQRPQQRAVQNLDILLFSGDAAIALDLAFGDQDPAAGTGQARGGAQLIHRRRADPVSAPVLAGEQPALRTVVHEEIAAGLAAVHGLIGHVLQATLLVHRTPDDQRKFPPVHAGQGIEAKLGLLALPFDQPEVGRGQEPGDEGQQQGQNPGEHAGGYEQGSAIDSLYAPLPVSGASLSHAWASGDHVGDGRLTLWRCGDRAPTKNPPIQSREGREQTAVEAIGGSISIVNKVVLLCNKRGRISSVRRRRSATGASPATDRPTGRHCGPRRG